MAAWAGGGDLAADDPQAADEREPFGVEPKVISQMTPRHRAVESKRFLARIDQAVPAELDVHLICGKSFTRPRDPALAAT
jgi:hypothetical protein